MTFGDVRIVKELGEEIQVTGIHKTSEGQDIPANSATGDRVGGFDKDKMSKDVTADDKLNNLNGRDELSNWSWGFDVKSTNCEVEVHDGVNSQVEGQTPSAPCLSLGISDLSIDKGQSVVIPVHEDNRTFSENQEYSISEFRSLRHNEHPTPVSSKRISVVVSVVTIRSNKSHMFESPEEFWNQPIGSKSTEDRECKIP